MKTYRMLVLALVLVVAARVSHSYPGSAAPTTAPAGETATMEALHAKVLSSLKLPEAKAKELEAVLAAHRAKVAEWLKVSEPKMAELRKQMGKYHAARDAETLKHVKAAMGEMAKLRDEKAELAKALTVKLKALLTDEQFETAEGVLHPSMKRQAPTNKFHYLGQLGLTKEQLAKMKTVVAECRKMATSSGDGKPAHDPMEIAWVRIVREVLTDKDRVKLSQLMQRAAHRRMVMAMFRNVGLSAGQAAKVDEIWNAAFEAGLKAPKQRYQLYADAQKKVKEEVLTAQQRKQLEATRGSANPHGGGHPPMPQHP